MPHVCNQIVIRCTKLMVCTLKIAKSQIIQKIVTLKLQEDDFFCLVLNITKQLCQSLKKKCNDELVHPKGTKYNKAGPPNQVLKQLLPIQSPSVPAETRNILIYFEAIEPKRYELWSCSCKLLSTSGRHSVFQTLITPLGTENAEQRRKIMLKSFCNCLPTFEIKLVLLCLYLILHSSLMSSILAKVNDIIYAYNTNMIIQSLRKQKKCHDASNLARSLAQMTC